MSVSGVIEVILIIGAVATVAVAGFAAIRAWRKRRTQRLRSHFGDVEYSRALAQGGTLWKAEAGLAKRSERVHTLGLRALSTGERAGFAASWLRIQGKFIEGPGSAVAEAERLLRQLMTTRGYPPTGFEQRLADVSVGHPLIIQNYRKAHEIASRQGRGHASSGELREAMFHYGAVFEELTGEHGLVTTSVASA